MLVLTCGASTTAIAVRTSLDTERVARIAAEQAAAVLSAKLEAAERRAIEADASTAKAEAATAQAAEKAENVARDLVAANVTVQAGQARLENAAREIDDAKKSCSHRSSC